MRALWTLAAVAALLWPAALAGPLDGVPLDRAAEVVLISAALAALLFAPPRLLASTRIRVLIVLLLAWKAGTAAVAVPDGWCLRFTTPEPVYQDMGLVPHAWDVRADWRAPTPECSAIVARPYPSGDAFPVWFFNLPPASHQPPAPGDRPPEARFRMDVDGRLTVERAGELSIDTGDDMQVRVTVDGVDAGASPRVTLAPGTHDVRIEAGMTGSRWRFEPRWNGEDLWASAAVATRAAPGSIDGWLRPWGRYVPGLLAVALLIAGTIVLAGRRIDPRIVVPACALGVALVAVALWAPAWIRWATTLLAAPMAIAVPRRWRNTAGFVLLVIVPWFLLVGVMAAPQAGIATLYSAGDDWWMYQRYAYRVFLQGYWLEGGQPTFWFQPLYRWIAGALHMVYGDSSVGEWLWDGLCVAVAAVFAFKATALAAGFRAGLVAGSLTLLLFTLGPAWYLLGRGLAEISSAGLLGGAALYAMRGRLGYVPAIAAAGLLANLAFYTRMNNLPMAVAIAGFAFAARFPVGRAWRVSSWTAHASRPVLVGIAASLATGLGLFAARTWYYTGVFSVFHGTQAGPRSVWMAGESLPDRLANLASSVLMVVTMNDPPRFDVRAVPVMVGVAVAVAGVLGAPVLRRLPLALSGLCLAGISGALVARGSAYPGRFSVHLIPVAAALAVTAAALVLGRGRSARDAAAYTPHMSRGPRD